MDARGMVFVATQESAAEKPTVAEMVELVESEAARIEMVQAFLLEHGLRSQPDAGQVRHAVVWDTLSRLLKMFERHEPEARSLFEQLEKRRRPVS